MRLLMSLWGVWGGLRGDMGALAQRASLSRRHMHTCTLAGYLLRARTWPRVGGTVVGSPPGHDSCPAIPSDTLMSSVWVRGVPC